MKNQRQSSSNKKKFIFSFLGSKFERRSALFDDTAEIINEENPNVDMNFFETPTSYNSNDFSNIENTTTTKPTVGVDYKDSDDFWNSNFSTGNQATDAVLGYGMEKLYGDGNEIISNGVNISIHLKKVGKYVSYFESFKPYFLVDNEYVYNRLKLIFFPFKTKEIERIDLYIPLMSFITVLF
jgi:hypothetical protein